MRTRIIQAALLFFGIAAAIALAFVVFAPVGGMRQVALVGLGCALAGLVLQLYALREADPHAFMVLRFRLVGPVIALTQRRDVPLRRGVRAPVNDAVPAASIAHAA